MSSVTYNNVKYCISWQDFIVDNGETPIDITTDWCDDHPWDLLQSYEENGFIYYLSADDFKSAAEAAVNTWNVITDDDHNIFRVDNNETNNSSAVFIQVDICWPPEESMGTAGYVEYACVLIHMEMENC